MSLKLRKITKFEDLFGKWVGGEPKRIFISMRPGDLFRPYEEIKARYIKENFEAKLKNFTF